MTILGSVSVIWLVLRLVRVYRHRLVSWTEEWGEGEGGRGVHNLGRVRVNRLVLKLVRVYRHR